MDTITEPNTDSREKMATEGEKWPAFRIYLVAFPEALHETDTSAFEIIRGIIPEAHVVHHTIPHHDVDSDCHGVHIDEAVDIGATDDGRPKSETRGTEAASGTELEHATPSAAFDDETNIHSAFDSIVSDDAIADDSTSVTSAAGGDLFSPSAIEREALSLLNRIQKDASEASNGDQSLGQSQIVLAGYGFGGFVIKQAIIIANTNPKFYHGVALNISSLIFFATPHRSTRLVTWEEVLLDMLRAANIDARGKLSQILTQLVDCISHVSHVFYTFAAKYLIVNFIESKGKDDLDTTKFCSDFEQVVQWPGPQDPEISFCCADDLDKLMVLRKYFAPDHLLRVHQGKESRILENHFGIVYFIALQTLSPSRWSLYESRTLHGPDDFSDQTEIYNSYLRRIPWDDVRGDCIQVTGPAGHGKSALVKLISQVFRLESSALIIENVLEPLDKTPTSLYQVYVSFLHQIISQRPSLFLPVRNLMDQIFVTHTWTEATLRTLLTSIFHHAHAINFLIVIYDLESWSEYVRSWWSEIATLSKGSHTPTFTFLVSCQERTDDFGPVKVHPLDLTKRYTKFRNDLIKVKTNSLIAQGYGSASIKDVLPESVKETIISGAMSFDGSFASTNSYLLHLFRTFRLSSIGAIEKSISKCPRTEDDLYRQEITQLLRTRPRSVFVWATAALSWILLSRRPLRVEELAAACAMDGDLSSINDIQKAISMDVERDLRTHLGGLVVVENRYARIVTPSARRVLCQRRTDLNIETDYSITKTCLNYLEIVLDDKWSKLWEKLFVDPSYGHEGRVSRHPALEFLDYACQFWPEHFLRVKTPDEELKDVVSRFLMTPKVTSRWFALCLMSTGAWHDLPKDKLEGTDESENTKQTSPDNTGQPEAPAIPTNEELKKRALVMASYFGLTSIVPSLGANSDVSNDVEMIHVRHGYSERDGLFAKDNTEKLLEYAILADDDVLVSRLFQEKHDEVQGSFPLHRAASSGGIKTVRALVKIMQDPTLRDQNNKTPLHMAAVCGNDDIICSLLGKDDVLTDDAKLANLAGMIEAKDNDGETPLITAVRMGNYTSAMLLNELGAKVTEADKTGKTALHWAVSNCPNAVQVFLGKSEEIPQIQDNEGRTALHIAAQSGCMESATAILNTAHNEADTKDEHGRLPLHYAAENGHTAIAGLLVSKSHNTASGVEDVVGSLPAELAAAHGHLATLKSMGDEVLTHGGRLLVAACGAGQVVVVQYLLQRGVSINGDESTLKIPLSEAASTGRDDVLLLLLRRGADVNFVDHNRQTPLHHATKKGMVQAVHIFLDLGRRGREAANINAPDSSRYTPLHHAALVGHTEIVKLLIDHKANIEASSQDSETPLHLAVGSPDVVKLLLDANANSNCLDIVHRTPLHKAAKKKSLEAAKILIEYGANTDARDDESKLPLYYSIEQNDLPMVMELSRDDKNKGDGKGHAWHDLQLAITSSALDVLKYLLGGLPGIVKETDKNGRTLLGVASEAGSLDIVTYLLELGSDVNHADSYSKTPLHYAANELNDGNPAVVRLLLERGAEVEKVDEKNNTPLHAAARRGIDEIVSILLDAGASVNVQNSNKSTPLYLASYYAQEKVVKRLLEASADPNISSGNSWSPLQGAADNKPVVDLLLANGADIDYQKDDGWTTLHLASSWGYPEVVRLLLEKGANPNLVNGYNSTPLVIAAGRSPDAVKALLGHDGPHKVDLNRPNSAGFAPIHQAVEKSNPTVVTMLLSKGADFKAKTNDGKSCLQLAVEAHSELILTELLAEAKMAGSDAAWEYQEMVVAYWLAIKEDQPKSVDALLASRPDLLNEVTGNGFNSLEWYLVNPALGSTSDDLGAALIEEGLDPFKCGQDDRKSAFELGTISRYIVKNKFIDACLKRLPDNLTESGFGFKELRIATELDKPEVWTRFQSLMERASGKVDHDGWNIYHFLYQASPRHKYAGWQDTAIQRPTKTPKSLIIPPKLEASDADIEARVEISPSGLAATFDSSTDETERRLRSDFPFPPRKMGLSYFEIAIQKIEPEPDTEPAESDPSSEEPKKTSLVVTVGFTGEFSDHSEGHPGWFMWSAGYHGDDGIVYQEAATHSRVTNDTRTSFGPGNTVGCGIDYDREKYFFTLDGEIIGEYSSTVIFRKLYPYIGHRFGAVKLTANFGASDFVWPGAKRLVPRDLTPGAGQLRRAATDQLYSTVP